MKRSNTDTAGGKSKKRDVKTLRKELIDDGLFFVYVKTTSRGVIKVNMKDITTLTVLQKHGVNNQVIGKITLDGKEIYFDVSEFYLDDTTKKWNQQKVQEVEHPKGYICMQCLQDIWKLPLCRTEFKKGHVAGEEKCLLRAANLFKGRKDKETGTDRSGFLQLHQQENSPFPDLANGFPEYTVVENRRPEVEAAEAAKAAVTAKAVETAKAERLRQEAEAAAAAAIAAKAPLATLAAEAAEVAEAAEAAEVAEAAEAAEVAEAAEAAKAAEAAEAAKTAEAAKAVKEAAEYAEITEAAGLIGALPSEMLLQNIDLRVTESNQRTAEEIQNDPTLVFVSQTNETPAKPDEYVISADDEAIFLEAIGALPH